MSDTAGRRMNENRFASVRPPPVHQPFPGGNRDKGQSRSVAHRQALGLLRREPGIDSDEFRKRTWPPAYTSAAAVDGIADLEALDARTDLGHDTRKIHAQDGGKLGRGRPKMAGSDL
jgi:hypothetical protein